MQVGQFVVCTKSCPNLAHCSCLHTRKRMFRGAGCHPQGHRVSQNQGIHWRISGLQILRTLCIARCESMSCSVMSNSLQPTVFFRETGVWKKRKRFSCESMAHLPMDLPAHACHSVAWGFYCWTTAYEQHWPRAGVAPSNCGHVPLSHHLSQPGISRWGLPKPQDGKAESWLLQKQRELK